MPKNPVVIIHGWSDESKSFQTLAGFLRKKGWDVVDLYLSSWVSMEDEIAVEDIARAMDVAWKRDKVLSKAPARSVDFVVHSTGALVVREWMTRYYTPTTVPIHRFLMLAPANFGSPIAHKGRAMIGRVAKGWDNWFETGELILRQLELASPYTCQLAEKDLFSADKWYGPGRILATVLVGNTGYEGIQAAANEDGGDGTVLVSTANLNAAKLEIDFSVKPSSYTAVLPSEPTGFAVIDGENHSTIAFKSNGPRNANLVEELVAGALGVEDATWGAWLARLTEASADADAKAARKDEHYHKYQNTVVHAVDDLGRPVEDYFVEFYETDEDTNALAEFFHGSALATVHAYADDSSWRAMRVDTTLLHRRINKDQETLAISISAHPTFDSKGSLVGYSNIDQKNFPEVQLKPATVKAVFAPDRTLFVKILLRREVATKLFKLDKTT